MDDFTYPDRTRGLWRAGRRCDSDNFILYVIPDEGAPFRRPVGSRRGAANAGMAVLANCAGRFKCLVIGGIDTFMVGAGAGDGRRL